MKYFTMRELTKSSTAERLKIDNSANILIQSSLNKLVDKILDPLRTAWGKPIVVSSGYRCPKLNKAIGGSTTSQHMKGEAADIHTTTDSFADNKKLYDLILKLKLPFDQLIWEFGNDTGPDWIHVSFGNLNRRQKLRAKTVNGKTVYTTLK